VRTGGIYWVNIKLNNCTIRDSFIVTTTATARPLGRDTTVCLALGGYTLNATTSGATSYQWQNGSAAPTFNVSTPGLYWVKINFGNCFVRDSVTISNFAAAQNIATTTSVCSGNTYTLPWGAIVSNAGIYRDTIRRAVSGCDSIIRKVTLTINAKPNVGADKSITLCAGKTVSLSALYITTGLTTVWTLGAVVVSNPTLVAQAGVYRLIATNAAGCSDTAQVTLTVNPKPALGADIATNICPYFTDDLTAKFTTTGLISNWTKAGVTVTNPTAISAAGVYQLVASNSFGCADTGLVTVTVNASPNVGGNKTITLCPGFTTDLTTQFATAGLTVNWSLGSVAIAPPITIGTAGLYQLIVTNTVGCRDTATITVGINSKPNIGNDTTVATCRGNFINLPLLFNTVGTSTIWTTAGVAVANPALVGVAGSYQLIATNSTSCKDTALVQITIFNKPAIGNDTAIKICPGFGTNLIALYNTTGLTSSWTIGGAAVANPAAVFVAGIYRLIVTNTSGCTDTVSVTVSANPTPNLGTDKSVSICPGFSTNLAILYNTIGLTSTWSLNNTIINTPDSITNAGVYQLIAVNTAGCRDTALATLSMYTKPMVGVDKAVSSCNGIPVDLTTQFNTSGFSTQWSLGGILVTNPAVIVAPGIYQLIVKNTNTCADTALLNVSFFIKPNLGNDTTINICPGNTFNLTSQYPATGLRTNWTFANQPVVNPTAINQPGVYQLIATNSFGCMDTALFTLRVDPTPTIIITNPAVLCAPQTADITLPAVTAGSTSGLVYTYWIDTAATIAFLSPTIATNGTYFIKGTNATGCYSIQKIIVKIFPIPIVDAGADITICTKDSTLLTALVSNVSAPVSYQWEPVTIGDIRNPIAASTIVKPTNNLQYVVTVKDSYGCNFSVSDSVSVMVQPPVTAFAGNDTIAVLGLPHQLLASGGVDYEWSWLPLGSSVSLTNSLIANPLATINTDSILFTVIVKDIIGCVGYDTIKIKAYDGITYYVPNAFSPNNDGHNDFFIPIPVGIVATESFRVFNRYGQLLFETSQWRKGWDGLYKGKPQPIGNYVWVLKGKGRNGKVIEMKGNVVLVR
jgi:gliding motility-associated-like protein